MKHRVTVSVVVFAVIVMALPVFAEGPNFEANDKSSTTPTKVRAIEIRKEMEARRASTTERRAEIKNNIEQRKASSTERRVEMQRSLVKRKVEHVTKVILATIERLEKIVIRIESRIAKIQERGGDTTEAEGFVAVAKGNLADARVAVEVFATLDLFDSAVAKNFETVRAAAAEAKEHIRAAHRNMMMAVRALKGPNTGVKREERATTTATSTSDSDD
ncbi:MAG: hypothetical protein A3C70_02590 [Candidatus Zambryskibacteria bacterium RIFCSPHIGHO2_02_FULL_43_14]|uniref:DUF5667 domain-containing protein n=1 Tax=Candidatus Zambryskibacteria bacterium RIFCSPHIGHO2_02_FULL_43_14 TaxID=1802748 RepID=A0A1G2TIM6_9BACT|nr:MAG: hypothetical protein A2829_00280 [Candidatus Zambryskibacteria bacterium RIFCSPHIGHO2_01_FULL_43_60]OHA97042.1 MAG: hypothetical protein A3C70_02590 [Candidatus Zambryskibacteria bacterium RIFCSPHIGHO2_02_FULL_43_14]OHB03768.1 MAG: hypothetical protein A3B03_02145 [Candidatus Zambryskibacteria bacterium RIFCSPLOWO2_01_FULL_42_41]